MKEKVLLSMPLLIPSAFSTHITLSILRKINSRITDGLESTVDELDRKLLTSPKFILPIQATLISSFVDWYSFYFVYPFELNVLNAIFLWIVFVLILVALWLRTKRAV